MASPYLREDAARRMERAQVAQCHARITDHRRVTPHNVWRIVMRLMRTRVVNRYDRRMVRHSASRSRPFASNRMDVRACADSAHAGR
jgi:hypothetical protein